MNNETAPLSDEQLEKIRLRHWNAPKHSNSYANYGEANEDRISLLCQVDYLTRRAKELEADAGRYRWLRDRETDQHGTVGNAGDPFVSSLGPGGFSLWNGAELDTLIDAALQLDGKEKQA